MYDNPTYNPKMNTNRSDDESVVYSDEFEKRAKREFIVEQVRRINAFDNPDGDKTTELALDMTRTYIIKIGGVTKRVNVTMTRDVLVDIFSEVDSRTGVITAMRLIVDEHESSVNGVETQRRCFVYNIGFGTRNAILRDFEKTSIVEENEFYIALSRWEDIREISILLTRKRQNAYETRNGGLFPYVFNRKMFEGLESELMKYQIFLQDFDQSVEDNKYVDLVMNSENCLIHALRLGGVKNQNVLDDLKIKHGQNNISEKMIEKIAEENNMLVSVKQKNRCIKYGKRYANNHTYDAIVHLGRLEKHYFVNDKIEVSKYAIENYDKVKHFDEWWNVRGVQNNGKTARRITSDKSRWMTVYQFIKSVLKNPEMFRKYELCNDAMNKRILNQSNLDDIDLDNERDIDGYKRIEYRIPTTKMNRYSFDNEFEGKDANGNDVKKSKKTRRVDVIGGSVAIDKGVVDYLKELFGGKKEECQKIYHGLFYNVMVGFDFETMTENVQYHTPYLCCYQMRHFHRGLKDEIEEPVDVNYDMPLQLVDKTKAIRGFDCELKFLEDVSKRVKECFGRFLKDKGVDIDKLVENAGYREGIESIVLEDSEVSKYLKERIMENGVMSDRDHSVYERSKLWNARVLERVARGCYDGNGNDITEEYVGRNKQAIEGGWLYEKIWKMFADRFLTVTIMAHNVTYDIQFLLRHACPIAPINRSGSKICGGSLTFRELQLNIRDSYAMIELPLKKFAKTFQLEKNKEVIPYTLYNQEKYASGFVKCSVDHAAEVLRCELNKKHANNVEDKVLKFRENIKEWGLENENGLFDTVGYAAVYCKKDVEIMLDGYYKFKDWVKDKGNLDLIVDNYLTSSSLAHAYFKKKGCFDGCVEINGIARYFIQKFVVGGRCMSRNNKKYFLTIPIMDFDGVSLYPSAMKRLGMEQGLGGYLKGSPKKLRNDQLNMEFLSGENIAGYFIEIKLRKIKIHRAFPLLSKRDERSVRVFSNEIDPNNNNYYLTKICLEDLMKFHGVKEKHFEIVRGYYFDEGRNCKIVDEIQKVFDKRVEEKTKGSPIEMVYKLIMNSAYGKTCLKERKEKLVYQYSTTQMMRYLDKNNDKVEDTKQIARSTKYVITEHKTINDHFNACHIGAEILAMSKRIMNEVMCLAEDNDIDIYYQDTDSMHINAEKTRLLSKKFKEVYGRELEGKGLGQFHNDFPNSKEKGKVISAVVSIILGKKAYLDLLVYQDEKGNMSYGTHRKLKGISKNVISKKVYEKYDDQNIKLYEDLYNGKTIEFDLLSCGVKFNTNRDHTITTASTFTRAVKFD